MMNLMISHTLEISSQNSAPGNQKKNLKNAFLGLAVAQMGVNALLWPRMHSYGPESATFSMSLSFTFLLSTIYSERTEIAKCRAKMGMTSGLGHLGGQ